MISNFQITLVFLVPSGKRQDLQGPNFHLFFWSHRENGMISKSHWTQIELTLNSHWTPIELTLNSHGTHIGLTPNSHWTHIELTSNSHWTRIELTSNSHWTHIELTSPQLPIAGELCFTLPYVSASPIRCWPMSLCVFFPDMLLAYEPMLTLLIYESLLQGL